MSPSTWRHLSLSLPRDISLLVNRASSTRRKLFLLHPPPVSTDPRVTRPQAGAARLEGHGVAERVGCDFGSLRRHKGRNRCGAGGVQCTSTRPCMLSTNQKTGPRAKFRKIFERFAYRQQVSLTVQPVSYVHVVITAAWPDSQLPAKNYTTYVGIFQRSC